MDPAPTHGQRLEAQAGRLRLLLAHLAGRAVRARVDLDDLLQEVYLRVLARPEALPPPGPAGDEARLAAYLRTVARHVVLDAARALRTRKREAREDPLVHSDWSAAVVHAGALPLPGPGPGTRVAGAELAARLLAAYHDLSPDHRRVLGLRQFQGLSAAETARRMGRSEAAVHSLYRRALEAWSEAAGA